MTEADLRKLFGKYATADVVDQAAIYKLVHDCEMLDNNVTLAYMHKVLTRISPDAVAFTFEQFQDVLDDIVSQRAPPKRGGTVTDSWRQLVQDLLRLATAQPKPPAVSHCLQVQCYCNVALCCEMSTWVVTRSVTAGRGRHRV